VATPKSTIGVFRPSGNMRKFTLALALYYHRWTLKAVALRFGWKLVLSVAEGNCVAERRGGEQPEANDQSVIKTMMNSIRPRCSLGLFGHVISESTRHQFE
jgi:hypothetical protein